jgi:hypothetical protein
MLYRISRYQSGRVMQYRVSGDPDPVSARIKFSTKESPFDFQRAGTKNQVNGVLFVTSGCAQRKFLNLMKEFERLR